MQIGSSVFQATPGFALGSFAVQAQDGDDPLIMVKRILSMQRLKVTPKHKDLD